MYTAQSMGYTKKTLMSVRPKIKGAVSENLLEVIGGVIVSVSVIDSNGSKRESKQLMYQIKWRKPSYVDKQWNNWIFSPNISQR